MSKQAAVLNVAATRAAHKVGQTLAQDYAKAITGANKALGAAWRKCIAALASGCGPLMVAGTGAHRLYAAEVRSAFLTAAAEAGALSAKTAQNKASAINNAVKLLEAQNDVVALVAGCDSEAAVFAAISGAMAATGIETRGSKAAASRKANAAPTDADAAEVDAKGRPVAAPKDAPKGKAVALLDGAPTPQMAAQAIKMVANLLATSGADDSIMEAWGEVVDCIENRRADVKKALRAK